mgnify:FL=1
MIKLKKQKPYFPTLEAELAKRGIAKKEIAQELGITPRALSCKLSGNTDLWWREILTIQSIFPDIPVDRLFSHS